MLLKPLFFFILSISPFWLWFYFFGKPLTAGDVLFLFKGIPLVIELSHNNFTNSILSSFTYFTFVLILFKGHPDFTFMFILWIISHFSLLYNIQFSRRIRNLNSLSLYYKCLNLIIVLVALLLYIIGSFTSIGISIECSLKVLSFWDSNFHNFNLLMENGSNVEIAIFCISTFAPLFISYLLYIILQVLNTTVNKFRLFRFLKFIEIDIKYLSTFLLISQINWKQESKEIQSNEIKREIELGKIPIGAKKHRIWESKHRIFEAIQKKIEQNDDSITLITENITSKENEILELQNRIKSLKNEVCILKKERNEKEKYKKYFVHNNGFIEKLSSFFHVSLFGYFENQYNFYKEIIPIVNEQEIELSQQIQDIIDNDKLGELSSLENASSSPNPSISLIFNMAEISPKSIDILKLMDGEKFMEKNLRETFRPESFPSLEFFDVLYCRKMLKSKVFPYYYHQTEVDLSVRENDLNLPELCPLCSSKGDDLENLFLEYELEKQYNMIKKFKLKGSTLLVLQIVDLTNPKLPFKFTLKQAYQFIKDIKKIKDLHYNCVINDFAEDEILPDEIISK